jgi:hypothetical protein
MQTRWLRTGCQLRRQEVRLRLPRHCAGQLTRAGLGGPVPIDGKHHVSVGVGGRP